MGFNLNIERREQKVLLDLFENLVRGRECYDGFNPEKKQQAYTLMKKVIDGNPSETADFQESLKEVVEKQTTDDKKFLNFLKREIERKLKRVTPADILEIYDGLNRRFTENQTQKTNQLVPIVKDALLKAYFIMTNDMFGIYKDKIKKITNFWNDLVDEIIVKINHIDMSDINRSRFLSDIFDSIRVASSWRKSEDKNISYLIGKTLIDVYAVDDYEIFFREDNGNIYKMHHYQDCCESVLIDDINGDLSDLVGSPILKAEEISDGEFSKAWKKEHGQNYDSYTWTFYKLATQKGYVTIRWFGESNGYYSEDVSFSKKLS